MQERLTFGSLAEKGSFFLNAGNVPASYAGRAPSLMLKGSLFFFYAARLNAGEAPYPFL